MTEHRFALAGLTLAGMDHLFGVWEVPHQTAVAFGGPAEMTWRVQLPASPGEARALLEQKRLALRGSEASLVEADRRLSQVAAAAEGERRIVGAFGAGGSLWGGPEARLLRALQAIDVPASFATDWRPRAERREISERWRAFLDQARTMVSHYARVETAVAGAPVGHTKVGWTGDFETRWGPGATARTMALHREAVQLALDSRIALVRLLIVVGAGAAKLALRLTVPGAQILVLPAAWRFVQDVLKELQAWSEVA